MKPTAKLKICGFNVYMLKRIICVDLIDQLLKSENKLVGQPRQLQVSNARKGRRGACAPFEPPWIRLTMHNSSTKMKLALCIILLDRTMSREKLVATTIQMNKELVTWARLKVKACLLSQPAKRLAIALNQSIFSEKQLS